eukprot:1186431-Prorocentrum_minimum.AAC.4
MPASTRHRQQSSSTWKPTVMPWQPQDVDIDGPDSGTSVITNESHRWHFREYRRTENSPIIW